MTVCHFLGWTDIKCEKNVTQDLVEFLSMHDHIKVNREGDAGKEPALALWPSYGENMSGPELVVMFFILFMLLMGIKF